ncbi:MAG: hypothetical protein GXP62_18430 [Oligoflexia bacterium]|nr:hypothetical protein [Oligoflexia bacterium]
MHKLPRLLACCLPVCLALFDAAAIAAEPAQIKLSASDATANAEYGYALAGAGDVNADGLFDVVVGAHLDSAAGVDAGAAYLYLGEETGDLASSELKLVEPDATGGGLFGAAVAGAGDTDGDGYDDLAIGAPGNSAAYIFPGNSTGVSIDRTAKLTADGMSGLGYAVAGAGDLNGDGFADVALGACLVSGSSVNCDGVVVLLGASSLGRSDLQILADSAGLGNALAGTGDVDGDGYADLLVGHRNASGTGANSGSVRIWWGGAGDLADFTDFTATDPAAGDNFGVSLAGAGDVNDDGFADVALGACLVSGSSVNCDGVVVLLGASDRNVAARNRSSSARPKPTPTASSAPASRAWVTATAMASTTSW